ncbi:MAG: DUF6265 family protein [Promethearchaeota archaeon]
MESNEIIKSLEEILTGNWRGKIGEDTVEEVWSAPLANSMMCMFRWIKDGKISFYEFIIIDSTNEKTTLKIKHFNSDFTSWEDKKDFIHYVLSELTASKVIFGPADPNKKGRLIFQRMNENKLVAILEMSTNEGKILKFEFDKTIEF